MGATHTVVYDGRCRVCSRMADRLRAWDRLGRLDVVAAQDPGVMQRFPWVPTEAYRDSLQVVSADGRAWQGAAAVAEVLRQIPHGPLVAWVLALPVVRPLAERFYRWFARNRYRLGCGDHCPYTPRRTETDRPSFPRP
jgi:predicted DCC family thiol-disulfide oxidoreductase YuxK